VAVRCPSCNSKKVTLIHAGAERTKRLDDLLVKDKRTDKEERELAEAVEETYDIYECQNCDLGPDPDEMSKALRDAQKEFFETKEPVTVEVENRKRVFRVG
jgi:hypothetical protein